MIQPTLPGEETSAAAGPGPASAGATDLAFEISAQRKEETAWTVVARLRHEDDAKAALWALVFTGQYAAVVVRRAGATALVAEWPAGLSALH